MLKWAMRIVAVGGAMLAMAVGTAAWMHRAEGQIWRLGTPAVCSNIIISPKYVEVAGWLRTESDSRYVRYGVVADAWYNSETEPSFGSGKQLGDFVKEWHGFGVDRGDRVITPPDLSFTGVLCPTWAVIAVLLLPMGLWAGIGWRHRRRVKVGHCANCGYDLRATPDKCSECGREVKKVMNDK